MKPKVFSSGKMRSARGFSKAEIREAKMDMRLAKQLKLKVDSRRKSVYEENVLLLTKKLEAHKKRKEKKKGTKKKSAKKKIK